MKKTTTGVMMPLLLLAMAGCNKDNNNNNNNNMGLSSQDRTFMAQLKEANKAEIDAGQTASTKGMNDSIRMYGQYMVTEHTMAMTSLDSLAGVLGVTLSDTLSAEHTALKQRLSTLSGYDYDTAYINAQVKDHQKVIQMMQTEISNGQQTGVKGYANRYLPHIQMHLTMADSIKMKL